MQCLDQTRYNIGKRKIVNVSEVVNRRSMGHRYDNRSCINGWFILQLVSLLLYFSNAVDSQLIGTNLCGCQPATYTFTFDFDLTCDDNNVEGGPGINETACLTEVRGIDEAPDADLIPITVQSVQIFELDQNLQVFSQTVRTGTFLDGSNFTYTSIISTITDLSDVNSLPRGLQLVITGLNNKEQSTVNTFIITYTNDCGIFPILREGQTSGWTIFSDLGDPPRNICPSVPSMAPITTSVPETTSPTILPSMRPTVAPITQDSPTRRPSLVTLAPIPLTTAPVVEETDSPVVTPIRTDAPVDIMLPTCSPIKNGNGGKGKGGKGTGKGGGKGTGKGGTDGGKGYDMGKGGEGGKGGDGGKGGKGDDSGGKGGKGTGKGDENTDGNSMGKGGKGNSETIHKKDRYDGQMDKISTENEDRLLATGGGGGVECPEIPDDDYYIGKGKGKGKGKGAGKGGTEQGKGMKGKGSAGKGDISGKGDMDGSKSMGGKGGKGDSEETPDYGKGKGGNTLMKKEKDNGGSKMEMTGKGKGKLVDKNDEFDDDYSGKGKGDNSYGGGKGGYR